MLKKVAILMALYNGEKYLERQLDSIVLQENVLITVFVSIDLSSDNTIEILKSYSDKIKIIFLPYGEKYGSAGKNFFRLVREADFSGFDYVAFSDQDDIWKKDKLSRAISCLCKTKSDGCSSNVKAFWGDGREKIVLKDQPQRKYDHLFESAGPGCTFLMTNRLISQVKKKLLDSNENNNRLWLHDWFIYSFSRHNNFSWVIDSYPSMKYRQHDGNVVGANSGWQSFKARISVILSGDGFKKVIDQAVCIGQTEELPIKLLLKGRRLSFIKLSLLSFQCRRRFSDKLYFFIVCVLFAVKGGL